MSISSIFSLTHTGLAKWIQHHPTLLDVVEKCRTTTRWPDECNVLNPACFYSRVWNQNLPKILRKQTLTLLTFSSSFKIINRVTLSDSKRMAVPESGSKCAVSRGLAPCRCEEPCQDPRLHCVGSSVPGLDLQNILQIIGAMPLRNLNTRRLRREIQHAEAFVAQIFKTWLMHHSEARTDVTTHETDATNKPSVWIQITAAQARMQHC